MILLIFPLEDAKQGFLQPIIHRAFRFGIMDFKSLPVKGSEATDVAVQQKPQVASGGQDLHGHGQSGALVPGIRQMVEKIPVRIQMLAAADISPQGSQNFSGQESAGSVAGIQRDLEAQ